MCQENEIVSDEELKTDDEDFDDYKKVFVLYYN